MSKKKIGIQRVSDWMHRNARELDLAIWKALFEGGEKKAVADALLLYQNDDGGFGYGLDMDNWNPNSVPYNCLFALELLHLVGFDDMSHPVFMGIKKYLNETRPEQWLFTLPGNQDYPHAVFYNYDEAYNKVESTGIIIGLSAFVIEYCQDMPVYKTVMGYLDDYIMKFQENDLGDIGPSAYITLLSTMKRCGITGYNYYALEERLKTVVNYTIQRDPVQWQHYGYRPSDFIKSRESIFYQGNEDIVEQELDFLVDTMPLNGIWPVSWCWFENGKLYPKEEAVSLHIAQAKKGIEKVIFLKAFDRIENIRLTE